MAVIGGVLALFVTGIPFSVSAAIGFIALFGIAVMDGIIVLSQYNNLIDGGLERTAAALRTGALQMRPVLMTCIIAGVGLFPAAMSSGIGSQVQKPLAVVVVGGMMLAPILILVILPVLILMFSRRQDACGSRHSACARGTRPILVAASAFLLNLCEYAAGRAIYDPAGATMIRSLISTCLSRRPLVLIAFVAFLAIGFGAFRAMNIEAYPDPAPPIIEIIAQYPGQSPEEVERYVTIPIEIAVASTPGLKYIRSNSVFALGFIRLQFEYGRDYYFVRQQALNRLKDAELPTGVQPVISPAGTISEIFRYQLVGPPGMDLIELRTLQDWVVERRLRLVPGVADVLVLGGKTKEFQAEIDLDRMRAFNLTLPQIITAICASNSNVGGRTISLGEQSVNVRGLGVLTSVKDMDNIVLTQQGGLPVLLSDIAKNQVGFRPRLGMAGRDDNDRRRSTASS